MTNTQPTLRDLLTIRDYLRERRDDPNTELTIAFALGQEIERLSKMIYDAESESEA